MGSRGTRQRRSDIASGPSTFRSGPPLRGVRQYSVEKVARGELRPDEAEVAARTLEAAAIELVAMRPYLAPAMTLAIELGHPAYDCIYLAVALRLAITSVTADHRFIQRIRHA